MIEQWVLYIVVSLVSTGTVLSEQQQVTNMTRAQCESQAQHLARLADRSSPGIKVDFVCAPVFIVK